MSNEEGWSLCAQSFDSLPELRNCRRTQTRKRNIFPSKCLSSQGIQIWLQAYANTHKYSTCGRRQFPMKLLLKSHQWESRGHCSSLRPAKISFAGCCHGEADAGTPGSQLAAQVPAWPLRQAGRNRQTRWKSAPLEDIHYFNTLNIVLKYGPVEGVLGESGLFCPRTWTLELGTLIFCPVRLDEPHT